MTDRTAAMFDTYAQWPATWRIATVCGAAVLLNAAYCIAYTHYAGDRETLPEALAWGVANIAPWVAAVEVGRHFRRIAPVAAILLAALGASLLIGWGIGGPAPDGFELVRRLPGLVLAGAVLGSVALWRGRTQPRSASCTISAEFDWARAAGNYVELHRQGWPAAIERTTLTALLERHGEELCRIHRSFIVRREAIRRIDRQGVLLRSGKRLPLGNAYRDAL